MSEQAPSKKLFRDRFVDVWYELTGSPAMHTLRYSNALGLMEEADREIERLQKENAVLGDGLLKIVEQRRTPEPPVNDEIPRAWFRVTQTPDSPHGPFEPDIDMAWGDQPEGDGWKPLYLQPAPPPTLTFEEDREEYARVRGLSDEAIVRECIESPLRVVRELANRYDVVCEKLGASQPPPVSLPYIESSLQQLNDALIPLRNAADPESALALDRARNSIARALHDMRPALTKEGEHG